MRSLRRKGKICYNHWTKSNGGSEISVVLCGSEMLVRKTDDILKPGPLASHIKDVLNQYIEVPQVYSYWDHFFNY